MSFRCPVESCGKEMGTITAIRAHITGSGGEHKGLAGSKFTEAELRADGSGKPGDSDTDGKADTSGSKPEKSEGKEPPDFPSNPDPDPDNGDSGEIELPCGHESFDPAEAPNPPYEVTCETCDKKWGVLEGVHD